MEATKGPGSSRRRTGSKVAVDSWAWVELFKGSERGARVKEVMAEADQLVTPDIVLAELARKYYREGEGASAVRGWLRAITESTDIVAVDEALALEAAEQWVQMAKRAKSEGLDTPSLTDALVLATARKAGASVITGDLHLRSLKETIWIGD